MTKLHHLRQLIETRLDDLYHYLPSKHSTINIITAKELYASIKAYKYVLEQIRELEQNRSLIDQELTQ